MIRIVLRQICIFSIIYLLITASSQADEWEHIAKGSLLLKQGKIQEAISEYEEAINENPHLVDAYGSLGYVYQYKLKDYPKAIKTYLIGLEYAPHDYDLNLNIMYSYFDQGDLNNGIKHYKLLASIRGEEDRYSFPRETVKRILQAMSEEQVASFCREYLAINPTDIILREILSGIYIKKKDYKNAKIEYEAMLQYGYNKGPVYFGLAVCDYYLERYEKALDYLKKAKQLGEYVPQEYFDMVNQKLKELKKGNRPLTIDKSDEGG